MPGSWRQMPSIHPFPSPADAAGTSPNSGGNSSCTPTDATYGIELYEMEKSKGLFDDALTTLGKLSHLPDAPNRLIYEESMILARKGDYAKAWEKMNQYIQSSR